MAMKKNDFAEVEYTGIIKDDNIVFDTTQEKVAKDNDLFNENSDYGPVIICIGQEHVLKGLDEALIGKEPGEFKVELKPEQAFGNKDAKLIQLIPTSKFKKQKIQPMPGLQVNIDNVFGIIKTVSGGRTLVDFNHPLSGKEITYDIKVNKIVSDDSEKIKAYLKLGFGIKDCNVEVKEGNAKVNLKQELNDAVKEGMNKKLTGIIPNIKKIEFVIEKEQKK
jgi:FKBP-type peptidyl-prolyl cis-trans isomerase SlyD